MFARDKSELMGDVWWVVVGGILSIDVCAIDVRTCKTRHASSYVFCILYVSN